MLYGARKIERWFSQLKDNCTLYLDRPYMPLLVRTTLLNKHVFRIPKGGPTYQLAQFIHRQPVDCQLWKAERRRYEKIRS